MPAILEFPAAATATRRPHSPDLTFETLSLWKRLRQMLGEAAEAWRDYRRIEVRATRKQRTWGVPKLHFFHKPAQAEFERTQAKVLEFDFGPALDHLLEDAQMLWVESINVRRAARAEPGLYDAAREIGEVLPAAKQLAEMLRIPEGETIRVIHPGAVAGFRVLTMGVVTVSQFHTLLADRVAGDPSRGFIFGPRPSLAAVNASRGVDPFAEEHVAKARFQFFHPAALRADGTLPDGFRGSDHWYWGSESLAELPLDNGERVVLIDEPAFAGTWIVERTFPQLAADVEVLDVMSRAEVDSWLRKRCPEYAPARTIRERAAA